MNINNHSLLNHKKDCICSFCKAKRGEYKGNKHPNYKENAVKRQIYYCKNEKCNNKISWYSNKYYSGLCRSCSKKKHYLNPKNHPNYKNGLYSDNKKNRPIIECIDCGKKLNKWAFRDKDIRCQSCIGKFNWKDKKFRNFMIKKQKENMIIFPNKPEKMLIKLLNNILPNEYKYVGNNKVLLDGFNPDFINCNGKKKIIEFFGVYWHNLPKVKERDKRRLQVYDKYGYETLILSEKDFNNKLTKKIVDFNKS